MNKPKPILEYILTEHARFELDRRDISITLLDQVLANPEQRQTARPGRDIFQLIIEENGKKYLIRIFVDIDRRPAEVVTGYKTSKLDKYWKE